jgi:SAM-dependent methyltransferase
MAREQLLVARRVCRSFCALTRGSGWAHPEPERHVSKFRKETATFDDYYEMLVDTVRNEAYARAIRAVVLPGDVVVDLGAGLGFLSFLAARAGAKKVFAIEQSNAVAMGREVAKANGLDHIVEFVEVSSTEFVLREKADVIVSETLGSFGVDENTLEFIIDARERLLANGGQLLPRRLRLFLAPIYAPERREMSKFWTEVEGVDFTVALDASIERMSLCSIARSQLLTKPQVFADIDFMKVQSPSVSGELTFDFDKWATVHGIGGWFEAELSEGITIHTSPHCTPTHWSQVIFPLRKRLKFAPGDQLHLKLGVEPDVSTFDEVNLSYQVERLRTGAEPLRNDPCLCGSTKPHKKCCGKR